MGGGAQMNPFASQTLIQKDPDYVPSFLQKKKEEEVKPISL